MFWLDWNRCISVANTTIDFWNIVCCRIYLMSHTGLLDFCCSLKSIFFITAQLSVKTIFVSSLPRLRSWIKFIMLVRMSLAV